MKTFSPYKTEKLPYKTRRKTLFRRRINRKSRTLPQTVVSFLSYLSILFISFSIRHLWSERIESGVFVYEEMSLSLIYLYFFPRSFTTSYKGPSIIYSKILCLHTRLGGRRLCDEKL